MEISKKDWILFKERLPKWQERHMGRLIREYVEILNGSELPSEKFWALEKRIRTDKKKPGVLAKVQKSKMFMDILSLLYDGTITVDDLTGFSDDFTDTVKYFISQ